MRHTEAKEASDWNSIRTRLALYPFPLPTKSAFVGLAAAALPVRGQEPWSRDTATLTIGRWAMRIMAAHSRHYVRESAYFLECPHPTDAGGRRFLPK